MLVNEIKRMVKDTCREIINQMNYSSDQFPKNTREIFFSEKYDLHKYDLHMIEYNAIKNLNMIIIIISNNIYNI